MHFQYNERKDGWFVAINDYTDTTLVAGIKVKIGSDLLEQFGHIDGIPSGRLVVTNWEDKEEASLLNFGSKVNLSYIGEV